MDDTVRFDCPESFCASVFRPQEMVAHLEWDHGYSERKAKKRVEQACSISLGGDDRR